MVAVMTENYWLMELSDRTHGKTTMRVLDHMIEDGLCEPLIVVTPTFYADVEGVEPTRSQIDCTARGAQYCAAREKPVLQHERHQLDVCSTWRTTELA